MRKIYHTEQEKREARRAYDHKRQQTEERRAYDRERRNTDEQRAKRRARAAAKREERLKIPPPVPTSAQQLTFFKVCPRCTNEKFLSEFPKDKNRSIGHGPICKECNRKWWAENDENRARHREKSRKDRLNPEFRARNNELSRIWAKNHPLQMREHVLKRQALKKAATIEPVSYAAILERDGRWCHICGQAIALNQRIHFDHVIPLSRGGAHSESNIKVSHDICNRRKADKLLEELSAFDRRGVE